MSFAPIAAGHLRHKVQIQSRSATKDGFGQESMTWTTALTVWADIQPLSGRELIAAQAQMAETTHTVVIRYRAGITPANRVVYQGRVFNVLSVIDEDMRHRTLSLLCSEGLNQG